MWDKTKCRIANEISFQIEKIQDAGYKMQDFSDQRLIKSLNAATQRFCSARSEDFVRIEETHGS